jgi:uncharacterized protein (TIGR03437 family)
LHLSRTFLLAAFFSLSALCQTYTIHTVAGGGLPQNTPGVNADLVGLGQVAADSKGNLFITLIPYAVVLRLDAATGILTRVAGTGTIGFSSAENAPAVNVRLNGVNGVTVDAAGNLYIVEANADSVAQPNSGRIRKVSGGVITTVAGIGAGGYSGDGGPALSAEMNPSGIAVDGAGNLYIAEEVSGRIRKVSNGIITTVAGNGTPGYSGDGGPATGAQLNYPSGVAVDAAGNLYIADTRNGLIRMVANGIIATVAGGGGYQNGELGDGGPATAAFLGYPGGVAVDAAGNLYIADAGNQRIRKVSGGIITTIAGGGTALGDNVPATGAAIGFPENVAVDAAGNVYFPGAANNRAAIRKVSNGIVATAAGGGYVIGENGPPTLAQFVDPFGVAVDSSDNLYVSDRGGNHVSRVSAGVSAGVSGAAITTVAGNGTAGFSGDGGPARAAQLAGPEGLAVDSSGNLYIADAANHRVRKIAGGIITTIAGNGASGSGGDNGPATSAQLMEPRGLAVDSNGNLYIADYPANVVRRVSPNGIITTFAGNGTPGYLGDNGPAASAQLHFPSGVALDNAGNVYIADYWNGFIRKVAPNGIINTFAGAGKSLADGPVADAMVVGPLAIAFDAAGSLYIASANSGEGLVRKVASGSIATLAGGLGYTTSYDAPALSAALPAPFGIAVDSKGVVYVADNNGKTVREVTLDGPTSVFLTGVLNAASNLQFSISPSEIVVITGSGLGPTVLQEAQLNSDGVYPTDLDGTIVQVAGVPAPIVYTWDRQVAAVVPYRPGGGALGGQITVTYQGQVSAPLMIGGYSTEPALFTMDATGRGQAAATNQDGSLNGPSSPAPRGSIVSLYATGYGITRPDGADGKPASAPYPTPVESVTVTIGGQTVTPVYAGGAPGQIAGLMQINVQIPGTVTPGNGVPVLITVGQNSQPGVTLAVGN